MPPAGGRQPLLRGISAGYAQYKAARLQVRDTLSPTHATFQRDIRSLTTYHQLRQSFQKVLDIIINRQILVVWI